MKVVIVGGGIGGLTLAHGLRRRGIEVSVHERDVEPAARWEGYRIHIDPTGHRGLRTCLPEAQWRAFRDTAAREERITLITERLEELTAFPLGGPPDADGGSVHHGVDRPVLRRVLMSGLDDALHLGAEFVRYEHTGDGRVTAVFADGSRATGDVLVGADGAGSRVRRQRLPDAGRHETGAVGVGHKVYLDEAGGERVPPVMTRGMTAMQVDQRAFLFTAHFDPPDDVAGHLRSVGVTDPPEVRPYVLAALVADRRAFPVDPVELDDEPLTRAVDRLVARWHPDVRRMLTDSDPDARGVRIFRASTPTPAWTPDRVTLLGDAIHQMPPVGGMGGNTALRDAGELAGALAEAGDDPVAAIGGYEARMRAYAYPVVASALAQQEQSLSTGALRTSAQRTFLRLADRSPALRRLTLDRRRPSSPPPDADRTDEAASLSRA